MTLLVNLLLADLSEALLLVKDICARSRPESANVYTLVLALLWRGHCQAHSIVSSAWHMARSCRLVNHVAHCNLGILIYRGNVLASFIG